MIRAPTRHPRLLVWLHWSMAAALAAMVILGLVMGSLPRGDETKAWMMNVHLGLGLLVFLAAVFRVRYRLTHATPKLPAVYRNWERTTARAVHAALYCLMLGLPLAGFCVWLLDPFLGGPGLAAESLFLGNLAARIHLIHYMGAWVLIGLVAVHIVGAFRGQFSRDPQRRVMHRMS